MKPRTRHSLDDLLDIMARLRDPETGCAWDRRQTFRTIAPYTVEEAYEVADTIERGRMDELKGELGDLLFQVVFYAQMGREAGLFDFGDIVTGICHKMIRRHPHVFADAEYATDEELKQAWDSQKSLERKAREPDRPHSLMDGVAAALPALVRAEKLQKRARQAGFDWPDVTGALEKTREELAELEQARASGDRNLVEEELGDLLFAMVNVTRLLGVDAEQALRAANMKFSRRFRAMEQQLADAGHPDLKALDLATLDAAWETVKTEEKESP